MATRLTAVYHPVINDRTDYTRAYRTERQAAEVAIQEHTALSSAPAVKLRYIHGQHIRFQA